MIFPRPGILALVVLAFPSQIQAGEDLWALLKSGGQVVVMRHSSTDSTAGDRDTIRLEDCSSQRNLSPTARRLHRGWPCQGFGPDRELNPRGLIA